MPPCIAFLLKIARVLIGYGKQRDETIAKKAVHPRFATVAAGSGTRYVRCSLAHVQRGILRAMMLERFLLARAAEGRDIEPEQQPGPAEQADIEAMEMKLSTPRPKPERKTDPDDPPDPDVLTAKQMESQVRRRTVGRTMADICLDFGVIPSFCAGATWSEILEILMHFGADLAQFFGVQQHRRKTIQRERDKRPDTSASDWRDRPRDAVRELLGCLIGETPTAPA